MNINPTIFMKLAGAKNTFEGNHPKFVSFLKLIFSEKLTEDTIIEITVTKPGEEPVTGNMKVKQSDMELLTELKGLMS